MDKKRFLKYFQLWLDSRPVFGAGSSSSEAIVSFGFSSSESLKSKTLVILFFFIKFSKKSDFFCLPESECRSSLRLGWFVSSSESESELFAAADSVGSVISSKLKFKKFYFYLIYSIQIGKVSVIYQ